MTFRDDTKTTQAPTTGLSAMATRRSADGGYILLEALVALVLLGIISYSIHGTFRQALITRGQAQDYTRARFLLEQVVAEQQLQPVVTQGSDGGFFEGEADSRFMWEYEIKKVKLPKPPKPTTPPPEGGSRPEFKYPKETRYLVHVAATVSWTRGGQEFSESLETLFSPQKLWQSPEEEDEEW